MRTSFNALDITKNFIASRVKEGDLCIDATAGRGNDTAFLCSLAGESGRVLAFDIQQEAVDSTKALLAEKGYTDRSAVYLDSHVHMGRYANKDSVACVTFNFGWLPGGDHKIHTEPATSVEAIKTALGLLKPGGLISMILYYGRDTGFEERDAVLDYVKTINNKEYSVITVNFSNRPNCPPIPVFIIRDGEQAVSAN